jgi:hypothetical protein
MRWNVAGLGVLFCALSFLAVAGAEPAPAPANRTYLLHRLPSELLVSSKAELEHLVDALDRDLADDLAGLASGARAERLVLLNARSQIAMHRGDYAAAQRFLREIRSQQLTEADKLVSGVTLEKIMETRIQAGSLEEQRSRLKELLAGTWGPMPWSLVGDYFQTARVGLERVSRAFFIRSAQANLDPAALKSGMHVPGPAITMILAFRNQIEHVLPFRGEIVAVLTEIVERNRATAPSQRT